VTAKRAFDITLSGAGLIASSPLWLGIAALVKLESKGPVFFSQARVGERGRTFDADHVLVEPDAALLAVRVREAELAKGSVGVLDGHVHLDLDGGGPRLQGHAAVIALQLALCNPATLQNC